MTYYYDLDPLAELARELRFHPSRTSPDELRVPILDGVLAFQNLRPKEETLAALVNADGLFCEHWHTSTLLLREDEARYLELNELDYSSPVQGFDRSSPEGEPSEGVPKKRIGTGGWDSC